MRKAVTILRLILLQALLVVNVISGQVTIIATASAEVVESAMISGRAIYDHEIKKESPSTPDTALIREEIQLDLGVVTISSSKESSCQLLINNLKLSGEQESLDFSTFLEEESLNNSLFETECLTRANGSKVNIKALIPNCDSSEGQVSGQYRITVVYN